MLSVFFVLDFIIVALAALYITHKSNVNLLVPTVPSIFVWSYLAFAYIGIFPLYFFWDTNRYNAGVDNQSLILHLWGASAASLIIITLTFLFMKKVLKVKLHESYLEMKDSEDQVEVKVKLFTGVVFLLCVAVTYLYISKIPAVPLLAELHGASSDQLAKLRSSATNNFGRSLHWYRLFYSSIPLFLSYYAFSALLKKRTFYNIVFFLALFVFTSFTSLMTTQKSPVVWYIIGLVIVYLITYKKTINMKAVALIGVVGVSILVILYKTIMGLGERPLTQVLQAIASRAFTGQIAPAYFYLKMFPKDHSFLFFQSFPNPKGIFPWHHYRLTVEVMNYIHPGVNQVVRSAPTVFWGEMYANFGYGGIILASIVVGVVLYMMQWVLFQLKFNPVMIGFCTWMILNLKDMTITSLSNYLFNIAITVVIILTALMLFLNESWSRLYKKADKIIREYL